MGSLWGGVDVDSATASDATVADELSDEELSMETGGGEILPEYKDQAIQLDVGEYTTVSDGSYNAVVYYDIDGESVEDLSHGKFYKFTVPAEDTYVVRIRAKSFSTIYYTDENGMNDIDGYSGAAMQSWTRCPLDAYDANSNYEEFVREFENYSENPQNYYMWIDGDNNGDTFEINDMLSYDELMNSVIELEEGRYTLDSKDAVWTQIAHFTEFGRLYVFTVPAYSVYDIKFTTEEVDARFIESEDTEWIKGWGMSYLGHHEPSDVLENVGNTEKTYYMWLGCNDDSIEFEVSKKSLTDSEDGIYVYGTVVSLDDSFYTKYPGYLGKITHIEKNLDVDTIEYLASQSKSTCVFVVDESLLADLYESGSFADLEDIGVDVSMYDGFGYTEEIGTYNGKLKAMSAEACPGVFEYDVEIAEKVLGFSDPDKVQECISTPEKFLETAEKMKQAGYYMTTGISSITSFGYYDDEAWENLREELTDNEYDTGHDAWVDDEWYSDMSSGTTFGWFTAPWFTVDGFTERSRNICEGPLRFYYSGYYFLATNAGKNDDIAKAVIETLCCDEDYMYSDLSDIQFPNNKALIEKIIQSDGGDYESAHIVSNPYPTWYSVANKLGAGTTETVVSGDVTGDDDVNISDLMFILNHVSGKSTLSGDAFDAGDVNGDGVIDLQDLMKILNFVSGKSKEL